MAQSIKHGAGHNVKPEKHRQQLIDLPLDVLIEIFILLEPLDLLYLARASKGLRAFFLSRRKSSTLWKSAISNLKHFPPCPDHISAPAYTYLAFVPVCHGCFCPCENIYWELRMRCCPNCFPKMTISKHLIPRNEVESYLDGLDLPVARDHYKLDYDRGLDVQVSAVPVQHTDIHSLSDWKVVQSYKRPIGAQAVQEFLEQQNEFWESIRRYARACRDWEYKRLKEKTAQLSAVRSQRAADIWVRLEEQGWPQTDFYCRYDFYELPEVREFEPLTPTEWTKIRPKLLSWVQRVKEERHCKLYINAYHSAFYSTLRELRNDLFLKVEPMRIDMVILPAVRSVVESNPDISTANYTELSQKFRCVLSPVIKEWCLNAVEELEQLAREELGLPPLSKPSCLPSVIFQCKVCTHRCGFDDALLHDHLYKEKERSNEHKNTSEVSVYDKLLMSCHGYHPRNIGVLGVDITATRRVENLVRRMGQNPSRVKFRHLRDSTVKVVCGLCRPKMATSEPMSFEHALKHCLKDHRGKKETEVWTRVPARQLFNHAHD